MESNIEGTSVSVPAGLAERLTFFGVWDVTPSGNCRCPRGEVISEQKDRLVAAPGTCEAIGKHPWWSKLESGETVGFPHGLKDAVPTGEWFAGGVGASVAAGGGRPAAVLPSDIWVLDVDNDDAWAQLLRLFKSAMVKFDDVLAVDRSPRGWHVWVKTAADGWTTGQAQKRVTYLLGMLGVLDGVSGALEVKSKGGYVLWPEGRNGRVWVDVHDFAARVASECSVRYGWGSAPIPSPLLGGSPNKTPAVIASGACPPPPALGDRDSSTDSGVVWGANRAAPVVDMTPDEALGNLKVQCSILATSVAEGMRNNALNRIGWIEGRAALKAGVPTGTVEHLLTDAGLRAGLGDSEVRGTVHSSLRMEEEQA